MMIPSLLLKKLYTLSSLKNTPGGAQFAIKNRLSDAEIVGVTGIAINGVPVALERVLFDLGDGRAMPVSQVDAAHPFPFPLRSIVTIQTDVPHLAKGKHQIEIAVEVRPFGKLQFKVEDAISDAVRPGVHLPRDEHDDYSPEIIRQRQAVIQQLTGGEPHHIGHYSFDPHIVKGNCENFVGVAQVPIGCAGPLRVRGEHADGEFLIPLATSEGTLIASHNREEAEAASSVAKLLYVDPYVANKFVYLRFNYSTGDAAGQNMVGRATFAACSWILDNYAGVTNFYLESNFATDKKASQINIMRTRGKRVTAEATIARDVLIEQLRVEPEKLVYHYGVANIGAFLSGANNNGAQSANGITAMFIATGQDVANVAESSAGILYAELTPAGDLYISLTIPSLIVATHGGGTALATQRECLEMLGCYGKGKVNRLAEIIAGVTLAGEISLGAAISSSDWVSSHGKYGRNR